MKKKPYDSCVFKGFVKPCVNCGKRTRHWIQKVSGEATQK